MQYLYIDINTAVLIFAVCSVSDKLLINKKPVISFRVVEDGIRPSDDADGNLVIDTSDGHQVETAIIIIPCGWLDTCKVLSKLLMCLQQSTK